MAAPLNDGPSGFDRFGLHPHILRGVVAAGFESPRPIQAGALPAAMSGRDVLGLAQTGTGKTAAFALPLLDRFVRGRGKGPRALILAPTRELATQIDAEIRTLARFTKLRVVSIYGGVPVRGQAAALRRGAEIVVGCPGRVLDLVGQRLLKLDAIETLVLDEADHMFDMGFLPDLRRILAALPEERQNLLFSATMPTEIRRLADDLLQDPKLVELTRSGPAETIEHTIVPVKEEAKRDLLETLLEDDDCSSAIVFTRTKHRARRLAQQLDRAGFRAVALQGNMSQAQRDRAMAGFRKQRFDVLVATDIAARGIDVRGVSHVINYDVPNTPEAYTHRIGRTGRSEQAGQALTFATRADAGWLRATERMLGEPIRREVIEGFEGERIDTRPPKPRGGRPNGARKPGGSRQKPGASRNASRRKPGTKAKKDGGDGGRPSRRPRSGERSRARSRGGRS